VALRNEADLLKAGRLEMTGPEIEDALFKEAMAADAYRVDPSPANKRLWDAARKVVDRLIEDVT
jgi:hypothetical protein